MENIEVILMAVVAIALVIALVIWGYEGHICKLEAIKSGMKSEEVLKACR